MPKVKSDGTIAWGGFNALIQALNQGNSDAALEIATGRPFKARQIDRLREWFSCLLDPKFYKTSAEHPTPAAIAITKFVDAVAAGNNKEFDSSLVEPVRQVAQDQKTRSVMDWVKSQKLDLS